MSIIKVQNLRKEFKVYEHHEGFWGSLRNLVSSRYSIAKAVEKLCDRMMIIDHGKIIYNGTVNEIKKIHGKKRRLIVDIAGDFDEINIPNTEITRREVQEIWIQFDGSQITASQLISVITQRCEVIDLTIDEPEIETIFSKICEEGI